MLEIQNLNFAYSKNKSALNNINLTLKPGEILAVIGENGSGKTTFCRSLAGILPQAYNGSILICENELKTFKRIDLAKKIAYMAQLRQTYFDFSVYGIVEMGRFPWKGESLEIKKAAVEAALNAVDMLEYRDELITKLSGGQQQRVFLARLFAQDASVVILDEPTNHLDLRSQETFLYSIRRYANKDLKTIIAVFHDINQALFVADKILVLKNGAQSWFGETNRITDLILKDAYDTDVAAYMRQIVKRWN